MASSSSFSSLSTSFMSRQNTALLQEIIQEELPGVDEVSFHQMASHFAQTKGKERLPLMEMNKRFLLMLRMAYQQTQQENHPLQTSSSSSMPSRPQGARSKNVSFDQELELHRQHFQQFATPPPPTPPVFQDPESSTESDLQVLMQRAMSERNYDSAPHPSSSSSSSQSATHTPITNGRKLHIGSVIDDTDTTHTEDVIDIEKLTQPAPALSSPPPLSSFDFFSKLKTSRLPETMDAPTSATTPETFPMDETPARPAEEDLHDTIANLTTELQDTKRHLQQLTEEFAAFKIYIYNLGLKETQDIPTTTPTA